MLFIDVYQPIIFCGEKEETVRCDKSIKDPNKPLLGIRVYHISLKRGENVSGKLSVTDLIIDRNK